VKPDFTAIFDTYGSTRSAKLARIIYADISYDAGDADTAIAMYRQALNDFSESAALKNIVRNGLGHAYILKGEHAEAIGIFKMIAADDNQAMKNDALFNLAWLYAETGETEKSTATFEQLLSEFPDSRYGDLVREKIRG
jgi:tetratricopeptide (TPR) repeat protein